jgi:hypothetical protein
VVNVSGDHLGMRVSAYLRLTPADLPLEVEAWDDLGETDLWYVRISSPDSELILRADDAELIESELSRWAGIARAHRLAWEARNGADTWQGRNGDWEAARRLATSMVAASPAAKCGAYWTSRAGALLAVLLFVASFDYDTVEERRRAVVRQVLQHDTDTALAILDDQAAANAQAAHARLVLASVMRAADQERLALWSTVADAIDAYALDEAVGS